jgi:hypothetical protein
VNVALLKYLIILKIQATGYSHRTQSTSKFLQRQTHSFKMQFITPLLFLLSTASAITVSYDSTYDNGAGSLATVSCSDGTNGLLTKGFTTFDSLPVFPYIGGSEFIAGWNDVDCGACYTLTYGTNSINVLAIDHTESGFNIAEAALNALTGGQAEALGRVDASYTQVDGSVCGL